MVISVRHFLDGLNEAGVPPEVYVKSKAGRLMDALKLELENRDLEDFDEQTHLFGMNQTVDKMFDSLWTLEDILRKSQKECDILEKEMDEMVTTFSKHKREKSLVSDSVAQDQPKLIEKLKAMKEKVMMKEAAQQRSRKEWLKQQVILVNWRNE
ncbi:hypothetical protein R1flu_026665 [Riccia fluitans]|uniref:Uncharacterized protein n=1 Tax=Riccia fluitans TaxID=41844 RepID=A0ABD1XGK8_9MARC